MAIKLIKTHILKCLAGCGIEMSLHLIAFDESSFKNRKHTIAEKIQRDITIMLR